jgi:hypothetical protein
MSRLYLVLRWLLICLVAAWGIAGGVTSKELVSFRSLIDHSVRLAIVSRLSPSSYADLVQGIVAADNGKVFDDTQIGVNLEDADVVVFVLSRWGDAAVLPDQEIFLPYYNDLATTEVSSPKRTYLTETTSGRPLLLIFYNLGHSPKTGTKCLAEDIVMEVSSGDLLHKLEDFPCK